MFKIDTFIQDYLNGKSLYTPFIKGLDFLFTASISSFIFTRLYYPYELLDISDYKRLYRFFIDGHFWIPALLFFIVHFVLRLITAIVFSVITTWKSSRWIENIIGEKITKKDIKTFFRTINRNKLLPRHAQIEKSVFFQYYNLIKQSVPPEEWQNAGKKIAQKKLDIEQCVKLLTKACIVLTCYFINLPYFGWVLFVGSWVILISMIVLFFYGFVILDVVPIFIRKMDSVFMNLQQSYEIEKKELATK